MLLLLISFIFCPNMYIISLTTIISIIIRAIIVKRANPIKCSHFLSELVCGQGNRWRCWWCLDVAELLRTCVVIRSWSGPAPSDKFGWHSLEHGRSPSPNEAEVLNAGWYLSGSDQWSEDDQFPSAAECEWVSDEDLAWRAELLGQWMPEAVRKPRRWAEWQGNSEVSVSGPLKTNDMCLSRILSALSSSSLAAAANSTELMAAILDDEVSDTCMEPCKKYTNDMKRKCSAFTAVWTDMPLNER